jgi:hypothetical protein
VVYSDWYHSDVLSRIQAEGSSNREQAITLYDRYLASDPDPKMVAILKRRLNRLRNSIDTAYYRYWFPGD